jgi:hypothetical protein
VSSEHRIKRLRDLLDQLERLPPTAERDRMLREVRGRVVDVDTGVAPSALPPVESPESVLAAVAREAAQPPVSRLRQPAKPDAVAPSAPGPEVAAGGAGDGAPLPADELLCLDDSASFPPGEAGTGLVPAWTRGLRG